MRHGQTDLFKGFFQDEGLPDPSLIAVTQLTVELDGVLFPINKASTQKEPVTWYSELQRQGIPNTVLMSLPRTPHLYLAVNSIDFTWQHDKLLLKEAEIMKVVMANELDWVPASHEDPNSPGVYRKTLFSRESLPEGRVQMYNIARLPVGASFKPHYHTGMAEVFTVTVGQVVMVVDEAHVQLEEGDAILVEPGEVHSMQNICQEDVRYVVYGIICKEGGTTVTL